ncbi:hypothetical protein E1A91_D09G183500v1 [Gossypium mustelinum]|uniref:Secreted protein n=1 Tax=Gossypium mustelinum TaxID=34275 RepID=A0A5D2TMC0_GOSMU|nr:hypothetical protein E1A91_D09G183500v1 [Gossypium mustelinum]
MEAASICLSVFLLSLLEGKQLLPERCIDRQQMFSSFFFTVLFYKYEASARHPHERKREESVRQRHSKQAIG